MQNYYYENFTGVYEYKPRRGDESETAKLYRNSRLVIKKLDDPNSHASGCRIPRGVKSNPDSNADFRNYCLKAVKRAVNTFGYSDSNRCLIQRAADDALWRTQVLETCERRFADFCGEKFDDSLFPYLNWVGRDRQDNPVQHPMPIEARLRLATART